MLNGCTVTGAGARRRLPARVARAAAVCAVRLLSLLYTGLQAVGSMWAPMPGPDTVYGAPAVVLLDAPPEGHPERLCPQRPMSVVEADLWARLDADP